MAYFTRHRLNRRRELSRDAYDRLWDEEIKASDAHDRAKADLAQAWDRYSKGLAPLPIITEGDACVWEFSDAGAAEAVDSLIGSAPSSIRTVITAPASSIRASSWRGICAWRGRILSSGGIDDSEPRSRFRTSSRPDLIAKDAGLENLDPWQAKLIDDPPKRLLCCCGRQVGRLRDPHHSASLSGGSPGRKSGPQRQPRMMPPGPLTAASGRCRIGLRTFVGIPSNDADAPGAAIQLLRRFGSRRRRGG